MAVAERALTHSETAPRPFAWTREQYHRLGELGWFDEMHVELLEGEILEMPPIGSRHLTAVILAGDALRAAFGDGFVLSIQSSLGLGQKSEPEPDVAVLVGNARDYVEELPKTAALLVEVSDSTLENDRTKKMAVYAKAGIADYWIVNLVNSQLEVHRQAGQLPDGVFGYSEITIYKPGESVVPLAAQASPVAVNDLLP